MTTQARGFFPRQEDEDEIIRRHLSDFDEMLDIIARIMNGAVKCSNPHCEAPVHVDFSTNTDVRQLKYKNRSYKLPGSVLVRKRCQDHIEQHYARYHRREEARAAAAATAR